MSKPRRDIDKSIKARRDSAWARHELNEPSDGIARSPAGMFHTRKVLDEETRRAIDEFDKTAIRRRNLSGLGRGSTD